jgi:tetratricopeptide (TPR) repeat protein
MSSSGFSAYNKKIEGKAVGYFKNQNNELINNLSLHLVGAGDGGIYSTAADMWKFTTSLLKDNKLLSDDWKLKLVNNALQPAQYKSWNEFKTKGRITVAGGDPGVSALWGMNNIGQYTIIVLSNYTEGTAEKIAIRISQILNGMEAAPFEQEQDEQTKRLAVVQELKTYIQNHGTADFSNYYKKVYENRGIPFDDDMILLQVGQSLLEAKDATNTIGLYKIYTTDFPNIVVAWNDLGDAYLLKGEKGEARKCFEQALKLRPANPRAKASLEKLKE